MLPKVSTEDKINVLQAPVDPIMDELGAMAQGGELTKMMWPRCLQWMFEAVGHRRVA
jgi:hypothetical protein